MKDLNENTFVDRRTTQDIEDGFGTPILYWYDEDEMGRRRTNAMTISVTGVVPELLVARAACSDGDQFSRSKGRTIATGRLRGRAQAHFTAMPLEPSEDDSGSIAQLAADMYTREFENDTRGTKRAFNCGNIFDQFQAFISE